VSASVSTWLIAFTSIPSSRLPVKNFHVHEYLIRGR
jgi:hypothetical protein